MPSPAPSAPRPAPLRDTVVRSAILGGLVASLVAGTALLGGSAVRAADEDPIAARQAIMKSFGRATKAPAGMLKGQPFDLAAVQAALKTYADGSRRFGGLFPDSSKTGEDTQALPAIWEDKDKFEAEVARFGADSQAAQAAITDEASFKATFPKLLAQCGTCHKQYRARD